MTPEEFDALLKAVGPMIVKKDTKMRQAITAKERLSLTLRFLATGLYCKFTGFVFLLCVWPSRNNVYFLLF